MARISDLKGYSYPLTPAGKTSLVGPLPLHYGTEYLSILYRADPEAVNAYLPEPLCPPEKPGICSMVFSRWSSVWEERKDLDFENPERTQYREAAIWAGCSFDGKPGQICLHIWVDNDFSMARGWFMGFPKRLGQIHMSEPHPLNPAMGPIGEGTSLKGYVASHGERLIEGTMTVREKIDPSTLPYPLRAPLFHIRHFPSIEADAPPSVLELVELGATDVRLGSSAWKGEAGLRFFPSNLEEHIPIAPIEVMGAYRFSSGYTYPGGKVLHRWA